MTEKTWEWFGTTAALIYILIILFILFFVIFFYFRKGKPPQIDKQAGDEGED
ncbi:hypothetical protein GeomeDRAFT_1803 [Geobacter metallireducens RCH3]|uniref:hypothetical protein n=1 Tax=Geobacter TaxID=28231 RepID=UPI00024A51AF|nr:MULTISPECIES: hypothetical protein [Geobacter]EHP86497.1 hypothetical protein GeomeDRAFT_1803 [Geobacter metallireducens RCH3]MBT1074418.1 hypothetical protein [Geobacter grbiciae]